MKSVREVASDPALRETYAAMRAAEAARTPCGLFAAGSALGAALFLWLAFSVWSGSGSFARTLPAALPGVALAACALVQAVRYSRQDDLAQEAFRRFAARTVEVALEDGRYEPRGGIAEAEYLASGLFPKSDEYRTGGLVCGREGATAFRFARIEAEDVEIERDAKGRVRERRRTVFSGVWFIADFHKHFSSHTRVVPDTAEKVFGKGLGRWMQNVGARGKLVEMESVEFEKMFAVYSDSQQDARYVLSPSLLERLTALAKKHRGLRAAFFGGEVVLALPGKGAYLAKTAAETAEGLAASLLAGIAPYVGLVRDLDLNTRIWTKE
ncbi:MAG: DUF3137 domain-containing protein [Kiritimatiellae bacterium]|nr:DUF3137 domain-containing protein [Kiritimatiellia bacterium]